MLRVENGTQPEEIREFIRRRALNPIVVDGLVVWNFNNHEINEEALEEQSSEFKHDEFMIPYQASGPWGYMVTLLPERIQVAEILTYQQEKGRYNPYPNYIHYSSPDVNDEFRAELSEELRKTDV